MFYNNFFFQILQFLRKFCWVASSELYCLSPATLPAHSYLRPEDLSSPDSPRINPVHLPEQVYLQLSRMDFSPHFVTIALHLFSIRINHKISEFSAPLPDITNRSVSVNVVTIFIFSVATLNSLFTLTHSDTKKRGQTSDLLSPNFISSKFSFLFFPNRLSSYIKNEHVMLQVPRGSVTDQWLLLH